VLEDHALRVLLEGHADEADNVGVLQVRHELSLALKIAPVVHFMKLF
jgi:hypothetical protein